MNPKSGNETEEASRPTPRPLDDAMLRAYETDLRAIAAQTGVHVFPTGPLLEIISDCIRARREVASLEAALAARERLEAAARRWANAAYNHGGEGIAENRREMNEAENELLASVDALPGGRDA